MEKLLKMGWPTAVVRKRNDRFAAYVNDKLVGEIALYVPAKWAFFHYGYGLRSPVGDVKRMIAEFDREMKNRGWTYTVKGGNPLLVGDKEPKDLRDFALPTKADLDKIKALVVAWFRLKYPASKIVDICVYAGMGWVLATGGKDGLGIRDIDINVFLAYGGARSLRWISKLVINFNGVDRNVDLYWNVLKPNMKPVDYIRNKVAANPKSGRWLTIPNRPWVSLMTGEVIWKG